MLVAVESQVNWSREYEFEIIVFICVLLLVD